MTAPQTHCVTVFADGPGGGNPAPVTLNAETMSGEEMRAVAASYGHEAAFVLPPPDGADLRLRFFVPNHEMEMCGHATVGAVWLLHRLGHFTKNRIAIATLSGMVEAKIANGEVEISQPKGRAEAVPPGRVSEILSVLGIDESALANMPVVNAATSRVKTLVPLKSAGVLNGLAPDFARIEALCETLGSTGLYPFAVSDEGVHTFEARQFPKSSGYPEDPATGIAAAALAFGLLAHGQVTESDQVRVLQGRAMGRPSAITVRFARNDTGTVLGCWLGGAMQLVE